MKRKYYQPELIDSLMESVPFEEVLTQFNFAVRGSGKNQGSDCPKCGKNHHHFKINTHKNVAHCFSCSWAGNPIQFIQEIEGVGFIAAVEKYAEIGQFPLPSPQKDTYNTTDRILYHAVQFYKQFSSDYLLGRGISESVITNCEIGYAPGGNKLKEHLNSLSFSDEQLLDAGVIVDRGGQLKDFFYNCVIIPVFQSGKVVDLYGRYTKSGKLKHLYLYGEHVAFNVDNVKAKLPVIIVESIINALTLFSHGITNVVATGGSHFTRRHARQLKAKNITKTYIGYDTGDLSKAGQKSAIEAGKELEGLLIPARIIQMPEDTDINDLFLNNKDAFEKMRRLIHDSMPVKEYEIKFLLDAMPIEWIENYMKEKRKQVQSVNVLEESV